MKRTIATALCSFLTLISFNGCCTKCPDPKIVYVPKKCVIPYVVEPEINNTKYTRSEDIISKAILNYEAMKQYAEKLLASQQVCK